MKQYTKKNQHIPLNVIKRTKYANSTMQRSKKILHTKKNIIGGGPATRDLTNTVRKLNRFISTYILGEYFEFDQNIKENFDRNIVDPLIANKYVKPFVFLNEKTILKDTKIDNYSCLFHAIWKCEEIIIEAIKLIITITETKTKETRFFGLLKKKTGKDNFELQNEVSQMISLVNGLPFKIVYLMYSFIMMFSYDRSDLFIYGPVKLVKTKNSETSYAYVIETLDTVLTLGQNDNVRKIRNEIDAEINDTNLTSSIRFNLDLRAIKLSEENIVYNYERRLHNITKNIQAYYLSIVNDAERVRNKNYSEYDNTTTSEEEFNNIMKKSKCDSPLPIICDMYRKLNPINSVFGKIEKLLPDLREEVPMTETVLSEPIPSKPSSSVSVSSPTPSSQPSSSQPSQLLLNADKTPEWTQSNPSVLAQGGRKRTGKQRKYQRKYRKTFR